MLVASPEADPAERPLARDLEGGGVLRFEGEMSVSESLELQRQELEAQRAQVRSFSPFAEALW